MERGSRFGGFVRGALIGLLIVGGGAVALSLSRPLPSDLPEPGQIAVAGDTGRSGGQLWQQSREEGDPGDAEVARGKASGAGATRTAAQRPTLALAGPALEVNAGASDVPVGAPLLAIVIVGAWDDAAALERFALLPMPLTYAIPVGAPDARRLGELAANARHEVLAHLQMPPSGEVRSAEMTAGGTAISDMSTPDMAAGATAAGGEGGAAAPVPVVLEFLESHGLTRLPAADAAQADARLVAVPVVRADLVVPGDVGEERIVAALEEASEQATRSGTSIIFVRATEASRSALTRWATENSDSRTRFAPVSAVIARRQEG